MQSTKVLQEPIQTTENEGEKIFRALHSKIGAPLSTALIGQWLYQSKIASYGPGFR